MAEVIRTFTVEHAGCQSCADRARAALSPLGDVEEIRVDEDADTADVVFRGQVELENVDAALADASSGSGHEYRVAAGSWRP